MRVLWSVNVVLPDIAKLMDLKCGHAISWVDAMSKALVKNRTDVELAIVCYGGIRTRKFEKVEYEGIMYYILPYSLGYKRRWEYIIRDFSPDVIHIYGTEKNHNIDLIDTFESRIPMVISLQGIISEYAKHYYAHMSVWEILQTYTLRDMVFRNGIFAKKNAFKRQSKKEKRMLCKVKAVEGRSDWDKAISKNINPDLDYYYCPRMIREPFWNYCWDNEDFEKYSLFVHQGDYPIKGLHLLIDAISILVKKYPDVKLYVSGDNIFDKKSFWERGYTRFIRKKIEQYGLKDKIVFTGYLDADKLAQKLSKTHVCVIPSAIENAPNALVEAMIVGTPCVASYVGGNADMLNYGELGLLYCYYEPPLLAQRIEKLFSNEEMAYVFSGKSREYSRKKHDPATLEDILLHIYRHLISSFAK